MHHLPQPDGARPPAARTANSSLPTDEYEGGGKVMMILLTDVVAAGFARFDELKA